MPTVQRFEDLETWKIARNLYQVLIPIFKTLKENKVYRFRDQLQSAAGSIMDNVAEGFERASRLEFINSLSISKGETGEVTSQLYRLLDEEYIDQKQFDELFALSNLLSKKIASFIKYLNNVPIKGLKFKNRSVNPKQ